VIPRARRLLLPLALAAGLLVPGTAQAGATWIVNGAGFGHGVGMSAYGAYGFGLNGYSHRQILAHYYPGTGIGRVRGTPVVRVLIKVAGAEVPFTRASAACGEILRPSAVYRARLSGKGVRLISPTGRTLAPCGSRLVATGGTAVRAAGGSYRGAIAFTRAGGGALNVINEVGLDDYVRGTLPGELFPSWPQPTLRAFAIAMRSIALTTNVRGNGYELYPDTRTQVYKGYGAEVARMNAAVRATERQVVTYRNRIIQATYYSASGGQTESGFPGAPRVPYLRSVQDPFDRYSPLHRWTKRFSQAQMDRALGRYLRGSLRRVVVTRRGDSPRILEARLVGTRGTTTVTGAILRASLGLYDTWASFRRVG
jgi:stage II sporulation protein D